LHPDLLLGVCVSPTAQPTTGSISTSKADKQRYAAESLAFNCKNATFRKLFPQWLEEHTRRGRAAAAAPQQQGQQAAAPPASARQQQQVDGQGQGQQQQQQQQQQQAVAQAPGQPQGAANANKGNGLFTVALVVIVLAIAAVPLLSTAEGMEVLQRLVRR
jgi:ubiquitin-conjugating enzyme E2 J2